MNTDLGLSIFGLAVMAICTALLLRNPATKRLGRPALMLTLWMVMLVAAEYQNLPHSTVQYALVWPVRLIPLWFLFEGFRMQRGKRHSAIT